MPEIQDIFQNYGDEFLHRHKLSYIQSKAYSAISKCRTSELGGHTDICENCGSVRISYNSCRILFQAVSETLQELCADKKYLGAKIGFTSILHTWGQNLCFHPHIHCVMAGGGLDKLGKWVSSRKKFLLPIKVLSRKFRGKFLALLKDAKLEFF